MTETQGVLDVFEVTIDLDNPTTEHPHVRDTRTQELIHKYDRCPDCNVMPWGPCYPNRPDQRTQLRTRDGWLTLASCNCGRLRWHHLERREGDYWLNHTPDVWGPIVEPPDVAAWMDGQDRATVLGIPAETGRPFFEAPRGTPPPRPLRTNPPQNIRTTSDHPPTTKGTSP